MLTIRKIGAIGRTYRNIARYKQILTVLFKYGFGEFIDRLHLERYFRMSMKMLFQKVEKAQPLSTPERMRKVLEELGPTFIKFGQIISTRSDLIPLDYIHELEKLQDDVPAFSYDEVEDIIRREFGSPPEDLFDYFDHTPLAAASIGQVHRARLREGDEVVVKIQRPKIEKILETDLEIMLHLASLMENHLQEAEILKPTKIVSVFARNLEKEIDYLLEAGNVERFARNFLENQKVYVPKVYREFSTKRVLTMEYIEGIKSSETAVLQSQGYDLQEIAKRGMNLVLEQIFEYGFFHADPHPGNIFILPENIICFIDFGMMGKISARDRRYFSDFIMYIARRNEKRAVDVLLKITNHADNVERFGIEDDMSALIDRVLGMSLENIDAGALMHQALDVASRHGLTLKPQFYLLIKTASTIEGLGRSLDPHFDLTKQTKPFIAKMQFEKYNPKRILGEIADSSTEALRLLRDIPAGVQEVLTLTRAGKIKIDFEHKGLEPLYVHLEQITNRIAFAIVLAALIVGSALVILAAVPPLWRDIPIIGLGGFLLAALMGFWLLISMLRHGKM